VPTPFIDWNIAVDTRAAAGPFLSGKVIISRTKKEGQEGERVKMAAVDV